MTVERVRMPRRTELGATPDVSASTPRPPWMRRLLHLGPAFVAAIAYVDPGNFATNFSAGSEYGYLLLWVIVAANLVAMLIQALTAKLGLATGHNLCEISREQFPRRVVWGLWVQAELVAMATDLAEVIGGAIALNLLFGLPLLHGGVITGAVAFVLLGLHTRGYRRFEVAVGGLFAVIAIGFLVDLSRVDVDAPAAVAGLVPGFAGTESVLLATGILGATVMPHVIYLHSALTQSRVPLPEASQRERLRYQRVDVVLAMGLAGLVNLSMLLIAAALFHGSTTRPDTLEGVYAGLASIDRIAALAFALALLASGLASSGVGTLAGQVVLQGYLRRRVPLLLRRALTLTPALIVLAVGVDPTQALVLSQVVLSFGIPFALVPLILLTRRSDVMGELTNRPLTTLAGGVVAAVIIALNLFLLVQLAVSAVG
ncbi:Nramp family divalent metal transporter [Actinomycetospora sp. CA-101289]|uniref:Nramp family divalent metal transporter n=1 Tax=Actinomycetospora sp. CA-101289 TaxID=3239893 RepID=UPI003D990550